MKQKKSLFLIILFTVVSIIVFFQFRHAEETCIERMMIAWDDPSQTGKTRLYENGGIYYSFLPACADLDQLSVHTDSEYSVWLDDALWQDTILQTDHEYTLTVKNLWGRTISTAPLVLMQSENIPVLSIVLDHGSMEDIEQLKEESGRMILTDADSNIVYSGDLEKFHIRGNYTAKLPKKPYALKFSQEVDLLGSGGYTTYCLLANTDDESRLRNKLVYETAQELGLPYSPESMFVDLYVDNVYYGLYLLTDKIDVHENRININPLQDQTQALNFYNLKQYDPWSSHETGSLRTGMDLSANPSDITGGYLLELEIADRMEDNINTFVSSSGQNISIKYPALCSAEQVNYIADHFQLVENAVSDGTYMHYIDLESFAKYYLMEEFFGQVDETSIFFYKDSDTVDPKLYAGPVWDFDWSFGLTWLRSDQYLNSPYRLYFRCGFFNDLRNHETFRNTVQDIYQTEFYPILTDFLPEAFSYYEAQISASHAMDKCRWYHIYPPRYGPFYDSLTGSIESMKEWVARRTDFFGELFHSDWNMIQISFYSDENDAPFVSYRMSPNSYFLPESVIPVREGYAFSGWYTLTGERLTEDTKLTEDTVFFAAWEPAATTDTPVSPVPETEPEEGSASTEFFEHTTPLDYGVLLILAVMVILVPLFMVKEALPAIRRSPKKRSSNDKRTKVAP